MSTRLDPRAERSRATLRAALVALLAEGPLDRITVRALAARAGVGYATFFRNYPDIDALLADVSHGYILELAGLFALDDPRPPAETARAIVAFFEDRRGVLGPLFAGAGAALERDIAAYAARAARAASGGAAPGVPAGLAMAHAVNSCLTVLRWWLREAPDTRGGDVAALIEALALRPIRPAAPPP